MSETASKRGREAAKLPLRVAALDVGSNAIRFSVSEFRSPTESEPLRTERVAVRLGHDVFVSGRLTEPAMTATVGAVTAFVEAVKTLRVAAWRAVATSAVRESSNGAELTARVEAETGVRLQLIAGVEEARLVHLAVRNRLRLGADRWLMADLGGGSVEVSLVDGSSVLWTESHAIGSVRLLEELTQAGEEPGRFAELLAQYVAALRLPIAGGHRDVAGFIATGGNIEALARLAEPGITGDAPVRVPLDRLQGLVATLSRMPFRERVERLGLREDRADVILPAALVYQRLCQLCGCAEVTVPFVGLRQGIMLDLVEEALAHGERRARRDQETATAATALGRHYLFDEAHALHVSRLAASIFDQLGTLHGLGETERRILGAAAMLHDIGQFVSYKRHHKHSFYLIANSELPGLTDREMLLVANVARYHRKGEPSGAHEGLVDLSAGEREVVAKLGSILRLADALDREHQQLVREVEARVEGRELVLHPQGSGPLLLEHWALKKKTGFFTNVFGMKVRVT